MTVSTGLLDIEIAGEVSELTDDLTIGLVSTHDSEHFPESMLIDVARLERALIAVREEFDTAQSVNIAIVRGENRGGPNLALYPDGERDRAVVIAPRVRPNGDGYNPEAGVTEVQR